MERSDATHVAVGATFLAVGGVILGILIPLTAAAKKHPWTAAWFVAPATIAGLLGLIGLYMLVAVYTGWWVPTTASAREAAVDLRMEQASVLRVDERKVLFQLGFRNRGRGD